jgi:hypothetical protein
MLHKKVILFVLLLTGSATAAHAQPAAPDPASRAFDFLAGNWSSREYRVADGDTTLVGTGKVANHLILGNVALREEWEERDSLGKEVIFQATLLRFYDRTARKWQLMYVDNLGNTQLWDSYQQDCCWYFTRQQSIKGQTYLARIHWLPVGPDQVQQRIERSYDAGKSWQLRSVIRLTR